MQRYLKSIDWSQYCPDVNTTQTGQHIKLSPSEIPIAFSQRNRKIHPMIHMESPEILNNKNKLEKKQSWRSHTYFKTSSKAKLTKTMWYWHQDR